jgi:hypothetical protein
MAQPGGLDGEIQDGAAKVFGSADQVPEDFTDSDYVHRSAKQDIISRG